MDSGHGLIFHQIIKDENIPIGISQSIFSQLERFVVDFQDNGHVGVTVGYRLLIWVTESTDKLHDVPFSLDKIGFLTKVVKCRLNDEGGGYNDTKHVCHYIQ